MGKIVRSAKAKRDLIDIYQYIATDNPRAARRMIEKLNQTAHILADAPQLGTGRFPSYPTVRGFPVDRYILLYEPLEAEGGIKLIRVFHGARSWQELFGDEQDD